jgi:hypothetical protein
MKYEVLEKDKTKYVCLVLLNEIINFQLYFDVAPTRDEAFIEPYLRMMYVAKVLDMKDGQYIPTELGRQELVNLYEKYYDYLKMFDIFCAVDLEQGEFAFSSMTSGLSDDEWIEFLENERFSDVRVAVAEFKGLDPIEIVFLSFLNEGRFEIGNGRWEYELTGDAVWREIEEICNTAISAEYLSEDGVLEDVIKQGTEIALQLIREGEELEAEYDESEEEIIETTTVEYVDIVEEPYYPYDYYESYYDPYYVSPLWIVPCILLF